MEIKSFKLVNVGRFSDLEVALAPTERHASKVTVLVGNNGAGKTTLLKSVATSLSWLVARVRTPKGAGSRIDEDMVQNGTATSSITIRIEDVLISDDEINPLESEWAITATRKGRNATSSTVLSELNRLADGYRSKLTEKSDTSLPLLAFYPVERSVIEIPLKVLARHTFDQLDGYDNALGRGVDFRRFFEWFREREDSENETGISTELLNELSQKILIDTELWKVLTREHASSRDRQLTAVRTAVEAFMPGLTKLRVRRKPRLHMAIDKEGKTLNVSQLSQGEKSMMALVGDIARRLAMMNPALENPLHGNGIVLIDEVDLHLHPKWQRSLIAQLTTTFPNCQFLLTTHSPLVISDSKDVLVYVMDDGELREQDSLYGLDANQVLSSVMDTDIRNEEIQTALDKLQHFLMRGELDEARTLYTELADELPANHIELAKASLLIRKLEVRREKD
ncbi:MULTISPECIES: AAA family ATPase [Pseudomonas syringae group genomosp. 2]|uniref:ATP binding protein n=2 Tax=Pseudomonas amygdali pv. mori TaxID=34065 RepID=A0A0P9ULD9_PSEA0|nr:MULTISPECIES: AAA family ATPase [Pseudomonas syringae group genomosp. 2]EGH22383.1 ATP binding protein [Pseudomonas amygdali pv. mori str. 301020]KPX89821.1 ATP binding protein [Pseudomonas amygdali pv. mori]RMQ44600.1 ATP binding protein [Pseudomonas amygdali pv. mori]RMR47664.1 ATP binding protein [Pseudomonas amygdali pv. mori]RMT14920.1 ATP binding protein [Pseudomonas amygdali pv. mori]